MKKGFQDGWEKTENWRDFSKIIEIFNAIISFILTLDLLEEHHLCINWVPGRKGFQRGSTARTTSLPHPVPATLNWTDLSGCSRGQSDPDKSQFLLWQREKEDSLSFRFSFGF